MNAKPEALQPELRLTDQVALVTGAAGGIGTAVCEALSVAGARVVAVDLPGSEVTTCAAAMPCDVTDTAAVNALFDAVDDRFGRLDIVVHAAGITRDAVVWKMDDEAWSSVLRTNLDSAFRIVRRTVPILRRNGAGSIVLIASINAERGKFGQSNYAASKAGLIGLGRTVARETGRFGIRVNVVAPGLIATPMTASLSAEMKAQAIDESALGCAGQPTDVAGAVLFFASDLSRHVTGQVLRVDGGQLIA